MKFLSLLLVAWLPVLQVLLVGLLGAFLASRRFSILTPDARRNINKVVYIVFVPPLVFSSLASTVTLKDIVSWCGFTSTWFMPVNLGIIFSIGAVLGWVAVKAFRPGVTGALVLITWAICNEEGSPFGDANTCNSLGLSYVSLSMALGNFYIWTHSYSIMKRSAKLYKEKFNIPICTGKDESSGRDADSSYMAFLPLTSENRYEDVRSNSAISSLITGDLSACLIYYSRRTNDLLAEVLNELWSPPNIAALVGFTVGAIEKMKSLVTEQGSPLWVIQDSAKLLGNAAIPCTVLILGGNLTKGIGRKMIKPTAVLSIVVIRFAVLPACGIGVVTAAAKLGFLPRSPLYRYVLLLQSTVPPAMSTGTIAQLFDVGEEECSIIFLWTYLVATLALILWSTVFMSLVL